MSGLSDEARTMLETHRSKWSGEIGRFLMAFAQIEGITYAALRLFPKEPLFEPLKRKLDLVPRIDLLIAISNSREGAEWERFAALLGEAKVLAQNRNLVAHNPIGINVYMRGDGELVTEEAIVSSRDESQQMAFEELQKKRKDAEALADALWAPFLALEQAPMWDGLRKVLENIEENSGRKG